MKSMKKFLFLLAFSFMVFGYQQVKAQCAVCSITVESNQKSGGATANGLNNGIMYLLAAPYLAVAAVSFIWYKKYRRKNVNLQMRGEKLNLN